MGLARAAPVPGILEVVAAFVISVGATSLVGFTSGGAALEIRSLGFPAMLVTSIAFVGAYFGAARPFVSAVLMGVVK